jgi:putative aldouronate transport system substrate-binding protein
MKKILHFSIAILAVFILASCGTKTKDTDLLKHLGPFGTFNPNTDPNAEVIERLTGQKVQYYMLPQANADEKLFLDIAGGADFNSITLAPHQFNQLHSVGALLDLTELIEEYGPNIKEAISDVAWSTSTFDGKIYAIPQKNASENINFAFFVREDILAEHGVSTPNTLAEFKTALQTLKDSGVRVPLCAPGYSIAPIRGAFGIVNDWVEQADGSLKHWTDTTQFVQYIDYVKDLNNNNLIQSNYLTEATNCNQLFSTGESAFIQSAWWAGNPIYTATASDLGITIDQFMTDIDDYISYIPSLEGANGMAQATQDRAITYFIAIPRYMKDEAIATIKWMNAKLDVDNFLEIAIGVEGETFEIIDGDYYPILTPTVDGKAPFDVKNSADWYLTGTREDEYALYWQARARKLTTQQHSWESINAEPEKYGIYNPIGLAPGFPTWGQNASAINLSINDYLTLYLNSNTSKTVATFRTELNASDRIKNSTTEINEWYSVNK